MKELKKWAAEHNIDLNDAKKKADVLKVIKLHYNLEEESIMEENRLHEEMEMNTEAVEMNTEMPAEEVAEAKAKDKKTWLDDEGNEISMSQFIREQFTKHNLSRKEISQKYDINYRTVYGATVNMENDAEPSSRGRGVVNPKINVTADGQVLTAQEVDGVEHYFLNNVAVEEGAVIPETTEVDRNTWIREQVAAGVSRGDVAKALDLSYGVVYGLTKDAAGNRAKHEVELPDGTKVSRSEYIRMRVAEGVSKSNVAKELGVEYSVVWQATKKEKTDAEKFHEAIANLKKFEGKVTDEAGFAEIIGLLEDIEIKNTEVEATEENK